MAAPKPAAELDADAAVIRALLVEQAPAFADLPITPFASGWDNAMFRLGENHLVRLPRRKVAVALIEHEQRWLPDLAERLPVPIPAPVVSGLPSDVFPWPWSVTEFVDGADGLDAALGPSGVDQLADFLAAMHVEAPADAPLNQARGGPLSDRHERTVAALDLAIGDVDTAALRGLWDEALHAPAHNGPPLWLHGDLHPGNVVVSGGAIASVIDFGDLTSGDPATDVGAAWMFFATEDRARFRSTLDVDDATWVRARGWALSVSLAIAANSADNPRYEAFAARALARIAAEA